MKNRARFQSRSGMALAAVIVVIAAVSILSMAILSNCALEAQIARNQTQMARVDYLAESGVNLALYYLQYPANAPSGSLNSSGYWPGATGITIDTGIAGTVNVTVTALSATKYQIVSQAFSGDSTPLSKTNTAVAQVNFGSPINYAIGVDGNLTVNSRTSLTGDVRSNGNVVIQVGASIPGAGTVYAQSVTDSNPVPISSSRVVDTSSAVTIPSTNINTYQQYIWTDGKLYNAQGLASTVTGIITPNYTTNPAGIFYNNGNVTFSGAVTITGTVVIKGKLTDSSASAQITPISGYPALIVNGNIAFALSGQRLTCNGVLWSNGTIAKQGNPSNCTLSVTGSLLLSGSSGAGTLNQTWLNVSSLYNSANANVLGLSTTPTSVTILSWQ